MSTKHHRVFGTTEEAVAKAETALGRIFPPSFRSWLLQNNGRDAEGVHIYPVMDERDPRKTWDSIDRLYQNGWADWLANFEDENRDFSYLLPFADYGTGDFYCFDYSRLDSASETPVVRWSHESGETEDRAATFPEFVVKVGAGDFEHD